MTVHEEIIAFHYYIGQAIIAWAEVEKALAWIFTLCFTTHNRNAAAIVFFSVENFRSRLQSVVHIFNTKFNGTAHVRHWEELYRELGRLSQLRNHLVHYHKVPYSDGKPGRRIALIPTLSRGPSLRQRTPKPPPGSLCLREIVHARMQFEALAYGLQLLASRVLKQKTLLPASLAQAGDVPTMAMLTSQIRAMLSLQP